jgi:hypothetical protein
VVVYLLSLRPQCQQNLLAPLRYLYLCVYIYIYIYIYIYSYTSMYMGDFQIPALWGMQNSIPMGDIWIYIYGIPDTPQGV